MCVCSLFPNLLAYKVTSLTFQVKIVLSKFKSISTKKSIECVYLLWLLARYCSRRESTSSQLGLFHLEKISNFFLWDFAQKMISLVKGIRSIHLLVEIHNILVT